MQQVAFFNENPGDIFLSWHPTGSSTTTNVNIAVNSLPTAPAPGADYYQDTDSNGVIDACAAIATGTTAVGSFQRADLTTYDVNSNNFIGGRPPVRPH